MGGYCLPQCLSRRYNSTPLFIKLNYCQCPKPKIPLSKSGPFKFHWVLLFTPTPVKEGSFAPFFFNKLNYGYGLRSETLLVKSRPKYFEFCWGLLFTPVSSLINADATLYQARLTFHFYPRK